MATPIHLIIAEGPASGREIHVPVDGVRIGRSSRNDISIPDDAMSRFQCRFFFKPGEGLWVSDLGSANGTMVNGGQIQEQRLHLHDEIVVGDTRLRVVNEQGGGGAVAAPVVTPVPVAVPVEPVAAPLRPDVPVEPALDLGLRSKETGEPGRPTTLRRQLVIVATVMVAATLLAWIPWKALVSTLGGWGKAPAPAPAGQFSDLDLTFERVDGSSSNIFRYLLDIRNGIVSVQVDDLLSDRHVRREKKVTPELLHELARSVDSAGVLELRDAYEGSSPGVYVSFDLSVTMGVQTKRVKVVNTVEPDAFAAARDKIEAFGKNELGLAALAIDPATLTEKAHNALLYGKKMWEEREVRNENLFNAVRAFKECEWYLETLDPKPAFYAEALTGKADSERDLQRRYDDVWFLGERAIKLRDWKEAARQLKIICEMIPDRSDERNRAADKALVDVERRLATEH